ncbi:amidohydrolase family protein [Pedobacter metabolipauper]|uniref:Amidohydrolase family protein n=1 Tax=Pedobacter metabolipauper TaxID=425513 RepID=A0A4R6SWZ1_9SPHI|nr:amidohydrolase family protein [Pedobacter metabolipauper]TDQ11024.1 amidohydrolase family protein [Pedobacter metabolipauper]
MYIKQNQAEQCSITLDYPTMSLSRNQKATYCHGLLQLTIMKYILKITAVIAALILIFGTVAYFVVNSGDNIKPLNLLANSSLWSRHPTRQPILIKNVTIVDTKTGKLLQNMDILLADGEIRKISPTGQVAPPQHVQVVEASGKYVIPGLINMHMHVIDYPNPSENMALMLTNGITGFRQMSGSSELLKLRKEHGLSIQEQQPAMFGMPGSVLTPVNTHNIKAAQRNVRQQKAEGADFIKIGMLSPNIFFATLSEGKRIGIPVLGHVTADANMIAASDSGFRSMEHLGLNYGELTACSTEESDLRNMAPKEPAILHYLPAFMDKLSMKLLQKTLMNPAVGTSDKEYQRISRIVRTFSEAKARKNARRYLANGTWQCPTVSHLRQYQLAFLPEIKMEPGYSYDNAKREQKHKEVTEKFEKELTPERKEILINAYNLQLKLVKIYDTMGIKLLAGTDDQNGNALQLEFEEFAKAGLSPLHILQTATTNAAEFIGRTADMGTVEQNKIADLVLLDANPLEDIRHLRKINAVIRNGYFYSKEELADLKTKALKMLK